MENNSLIKRMIWEYLHVKKEKTAFSLYDGEMVREVSYQEFAQDILQVAGYFVSRNIKRQHISIMAPNSYDWLVTYFAVIGSGNVAIMMNQALPVNDLLWQFKKADVSLVCTDQETLDAVKDSMAGVNCVSFEQMKADAAVTADMLYDAKENDTIQMLFTSGTTGSSKAVELTDGNWTAVMHTFDEMYFTEGVERISIPVPFYHALGLENAIISLFHGKTICLGRGVKYLFMDLAELNPDVMIAVPSIAESLAKILRRCADLKDRQKYTGKNLWQICFAGAALKEPVLRTLLGCGFTMSVNYGMSEIPGAVSWGIIDREKRYRTAGKFVSITQYKFVDKELMVKSPVLMKGYYKDPEETAKVIEDGWIHTGDLGHVDEDGYFYLTGRKKNVIILSNGENVNPEEIENNFGACLDILECMVFGDGTGICADVYTDNQDAVSAFIKEYNKGTPAYRQVYKVNYSAVPLEKTGSGKIKRKVNIYE